LPSRALQPPRQRAALGGGLPRAGVARQRDLLRHARLPQSVGRASAAARAAGNPAAARARAARERRRARGTDPVVAQPDASDGFADVRLNMRLACALGFCAAVAACNPQYDTSSPRFTVAPTPSSVSDRYVTVSWET